MTNNLEFLSFVECPGEKYLGIATIRLNRTLVLRFKIVPKKDGSGYFPACASYKVPDGNGGERYIEAVMFDSRSEDEDVKSFVISGWKKSQQKANTSVFESSKQSEDEVPF